MTARRLIIWRHGRTEWNHTGRFQGQADVALDDVGRDQAAVAAQVLAGYRPDVIVASDLSRARATAGALAELTGLEVRLDKRLREIHVGSWEGLTAEQIAEQDPEFADHWARGIDMRRSSTGETSVEVAERAAEALAEIAAGAPDESTVVVAMHGLSGRVGACHFVGLPEPAWYALAGMVNCGWIVLELSRAGHWRIDGYNLTATLAG